MKLGLHLIETPSGRWAFVGCVPPVLAVACDDPELVAVAREHGPGLARRMAAARGCRFDTLSWPTREAALQAAEAVGYVPGSAGHPFTLKQKSIDA